MYQMSQTPTPIKFGLVKSRQSTCMVNQGYPWPIGDIFIQYRQVDNQQEE